MLAITGKCNGVKTKSLIGRKLGNFQVKRLLGRGGMAEVYYGWDVKLHRHVAIKVIEVKNWTKRSQASRFIQEARVMASWRHENIIPIYYAGDETGIYYYVLVCCIIHVNFSDPPRGKDLHRC